MIFGVHNHYNNNADSIGNLESPHERWMPGELPVRITNKGITMFTLNKMLGIEGKLSLAAALDKNLKKTFGQGLGLATCGVSDCLLDFEMKPYYEGIKAVNPEIVTIFSAYATWTDKPEDREWINLPDRKNIDHVFEASQKAWGSIVAIMKPSVQDRTEPAEGWFAYQDLLENIYKRALMEAQTAQSRPRPRA